jgi:hypothetical protein
MDFMTVKACQAQTLHLIEQRTLKNVNTSYLETPGGQSSNQHLNLVPFFNTRASTIKLFTAVIVAIMQ